MAETAGESWWLKVGILYDKNGFKGVVGGMLDIKRATVSLYDSFRKVVDVNSDLYNTSKYLGVTTNDLQLWERAFRLIGGSADDARGAISSLNFVYDKLRLGLDQGAAETGARLGLTPEDYVTFDRMLKALNRTYNEMYQGDYGGFKVLAEQLGLSESAILMVTQSTSQFEDTLSRASRIPFITEEQLRDSRELNKMFTELSIQWDVFKFKLLSTATPGVEKLFKRLGELIDDPDTIQKIDALFTQIEDSINRMASNENLNDLVELLTTLVKAGMQVAEWGVDVGKFVKFSSEYYGEKAGQTHGAIEKFFNEHPMTGRIATNALRVIDPTATLRAGYGTIKDAVVNISINGADNPKDVAAAVVDAISEHFGFNQNSNMRTVDNARASASL